MTKPREKTREELQAEIEDGKKKIRQFENRERCCVKSYPKRNAGQQHRRCRKQKQKQMQPSKGRYRKFVHFTRRNIFPVFSSRNRLNSSTVPPVRVRLSKGCANRFFIRRMM